MYLAEERHVLFVELRRLLHVPRLVDIGVFVLEIYNVVLDGLDLSQVLTETEVIHDVPLGGIHIKRLLLELCHAVGNLGEIVVQCCHLALEPLHLLFAFSKPLETASLDVLLDPLLDAVEVHVGLGELCGFALLLVFFLGAFAGYFFELCLCGQDVGGQALELAVGFFDYGALLAAGLAVLFDAIL